jgi:hypothetical protein
MVGGMGTALGGGRGGSPGTMVGSLQNLGFNNEEIIVFLLTQQTRSQQLFIMQSVLPESRQSSNKRSEDAVWRGHQQ